MEKMDQDGTMGIAVADCSKQPDILYHPDEAKYLARTARRLAEDPSLPDVPLPDGFPPRVEGPIVWDGGDWASEDQWVYRLGGAELKEIDAALEHFKGTGKALGYISKETFPLPTLGPVLKDLARELYSGRGFFVLRTIPVDQYTKTDLAIVYAGTFSRFLCIYLGLCLLSGLSAHVGSARGKQDSTGAVLAHIKDLTVSHAHEEGGIGNSAYTTDKQVFHTDVGDLIALLAIQSAAEGGVSRISSGGKVYNDIAATRPDLIHTLAEPWPLDSFGGSPGYTTRPLLYNENGHIIIQYSRRHFTGYGLQKRSPHIPPISEAQAEALDALHFAAEKHSLGLNFQKGDIQYINSLGLLHSRDAFRDDEQHTRHLIRLWLRNDELAWKTPGPLQHIWKRRKENGATK
ncbi:hypothetical protein IW261DRAFT_535872 [Armillaria novae-zelandiae]|uniref:TauD/TfdA-like domain-containing protein n=1 Tax=Armillaria novae-zelandiae TaxID=153914 RepID=A0AA39P067_9AGAR|nr:hypothetical protein IW261DRAFT_535872 [Armillaria novae-zelandiae]